MPFIYFGFNIYLRITKKKLKNQQKRTNSSVLKLKLSDNGIIFTALLLISMYYIQQKLKQTNSTVLILYYKKSGL